MVKTLHSFQCKGRRFHLWSGNQDPTYITEAKSNKSWRKINLRGQTAEGSCMRALKLSGIEADVTLEGTTMS